MKVKQLLSHFWFGASEIEQIKVCLCSKVLDVLTTDDLSKRDYHGFEAESVNSFKIRDHEMVIYLK